MKRLGGLVLLIVLIGITPAQAREGLFIGASISYTGLSVHSDDSLDKEYFGSLKGGPGFGLNLGWGFNDYWAIEASFTRSYHKTTFLGLANLKNQVLEGHSLLLKVSLPSNLIVDNPDKSPLFFNLANWFKPFEPYLILGGGQYQIGDSANTYYKGYGADYGIGVDLFASSAVSVNLGFTGRSISFTKGKFVSSSKETSVSSASFDIGVAYHF